MCVLCITHQIVLIYRVAGTKDNPCPVQIQPILLTTGGNPYLKAHIFNSEYLQRFFVDSGRLSIGLRIQKEQEWANVKQVRTD